MRGLAETSLSLSGVMDVIFRPSIGLTNLTSFCMPPSWWLTGHVLCSSLAPYLSEISWHGFNGSANTERFRACDKLRLWFRVCVAPASSLQVVQDVIMWSISIAQCLDYMMFLVISAFVFYLRGNQLDNMSFGHLC